VERGSKIADTEGAESGAGVAWLTCRQVAKFEGVTRQEINRRCNSGELFSVVPNGKQGG
jgi:hypothetical protein